MLGWWNICLRFGTMFVLYPQYIWTVNSAGKLNVKKSAFAMRQRKTSLKETRKRIKGLLCYVDWLRKQSWVLSLLCILSASKQTHQCRKVRCKKWACYVMRQRKSTFEGMRKLINGLLCYVYWLMKTKLGTRFVMQSMMENIIEIDGNFFYQGRVVLIILTDLGNKVGY